MQPKPNINRKFYVFVAPKDESDTPTLLNIKDSMVSAREVAMVYAASSVYADSYFTIAEEVCRCYGYGNIPRVRFDPPEGNGWPVQDE